MEQELQQLQQELDNLRQQLKYYEDEKKHPIKHNRQLQMENKHLKEKVGELEKLIDEDQITFSVSADDFVGENPLLNDIYRKSFSKPNPLSKKQSNTVLLSPDLSTAPSP